MSFIILQVLWKQFLIAYQQVVDERNTGNPVTMFYFATALDVVLPSGKVPHKVSPVHEIQLIGKEELDILPLGRHIYHYHFSTLVVRYVIAFYVYPLLVERGV